MIRDWLFVPKQTPKVTHGVSTPLLKQEPQPEREMELRESVEAFADELGETLDGYIERQRLGDQALNSREYRRMTDALDELERALDQAIAGEQQVLQAFTTLLASLSGSGAGLGHDGRRIEELGTGAADRARAGMQQLRQRIEQEVLIHLDVPEEVAESAEVWSEAADAVEHLRPVVEKARRVPGWGGEAARSYDELADAQAGAHEEFEGLPRAMAEAYEVISTLNRAVLIAVHATLRLTLQQATSHGLSAPGQLFGRVQRFERAIERCNTELLPEALDIAGEGSKQVQGRARDAQQGKRIIAKAWPSRAEGHPGPTALA
ncbi:hypothetical protein [uncultured Tessaracoccus sp.]|uniref:hypothetical protein n=1 Tax=uncultured Tessaracoccus sp. TaxID=905023 RepID=UPI0025E02C0D|nr:hypothetical protein [uncultured Tessaracoccus sp.]